MALAGGLALSFTTIGLFVALIGFSIGLDLSVFRQVSAILLVAIGGLLLLPAAQTRLAVIAGPVGGYAEQRLGGFSTRGLSGQFGVGLLLGAVWSPCVGPTLGAASIMAARGENLGQVSLTMLAFGLGAGLPLLALGLLSREAMARWRARLMGTGRMGKSVMGALLVTVGILILTGMDKALETAFLDQAPDWLVQLTTRF